MSLVIEESPVEPQLTVEEMIQQDLEDIRNTALPSTVLSAEAIVEMLDGTEPTTRKALVLAQNLETVVSLGVRGKQEKPEALLAVQSLNWNLETQLTDLEAPTKPNLLTRLLQFQMLFSFHLTSVNEGGDVRESLKEELTDLLRDLS